MTQSDSFLLERWIRKHDAEAFRELVERYSRMVYSTARRILQSPDHADDVTQECFFKLAQVSDSRPRRVGGWLHRVATNCAISLLRSEKRRHTIEASQALGRESAHESPWEEIESWIDEAIERLPSKQRTPLVEHYLFGRTHESIANDAGVSRKTIAYRIRIGIESVRKALKSKGLNAKASMIAGGLAALTASQACALPTTLSMSLGKIAVGGRHTASGLKSAVTKVHSASGSSGAMKLLYALIAGAALLIGGIFIFTTDGDSATKTHPEKALITSVGTAENDLEKQTPESAPFSDSAQEAAGDGKKTEDTKEQAASVEEIERILAGTVIDEEEKPVAGADVFMALHPLPEGNDPIERENMLHADYWQSGLVHVVTTEQDGRFEFVDVPEEGRVSLIAFKKNYYCKQMRITIEDEKAHDDLKLKLTGGRLLRGVVFSQDGATIPGAVVSIYHSYNEKGYAGYSGFSLADQAGRFTIAVHPDARNLTMRVNTAEFGQQFFTEVPAGPDEVELRFQAWCTVRGTIMWSDKEPACGVRVCVDAEVPEPRMLTMYSGWRLRLEQAAEAGADGTYEITGLHPGFTYDIFVVDPEKDRRERLLHPLSPRWKNRFSLKAGETKTWDYALTRMIRIKGRIITAETKIPQPRLQVGVYKDGKYIRTIHCEANAKGEYDLRINRGPGKYRITATSNWGMDSVTGYIADKYGQTFTFEGGEEREVDLEIFEPVEVPIRVLDAAGNPVKSIRALVDAKITEEKRKRFRLDSSYSLDDEGRYSFRLYHPVKELRLEIGAFPEGLKKKLGPYTAEVGEVLPERTISLYPTCDLTGVIINAAGEPLKNASIKIQAQFEDGIRDQFYVQTKKDGRFEKKSRLRSAPVTLKLFFDRSKKAWDSGPLSPVEGQELSLGEIIAPE